MLFCSKSPYNSLHFSFLPPQSTFELNIERSITPQVVGPALQANESLDGLFLFLDARRCFCGAFFRRGLIHPVHVRDGPFNERRGSPS